MTARGRFITVEGIEGVGKSTNIGFIAERLRDAGLEVVTTREPGGTPTAERIRGILKEHGDEPLPETAELLLMFAARAINVSHTIRPALESGAWVVADRFTDATLAYQGGGRGIPRRHIDEIAALVHGDVNPELTILLDTPVATGMRRAGSRGAPDRIEVEQAGFFERVRNTYLELVAEAPQRFVLIDATRDLTAVQADIGRAIDTLLHQRVD